MTRISSFILIGNTFPLALARRKITIVPASREELAAAAEGKHIVSFWGHENTMHVASAMIGFDLTPATSRPVITLSKEGVPSLDGNVFRECWVVSPDYADNFRPELGEEVTSDQISGWQILRLTWE